MKVATRGFAVKFADITTLKGAIRGKIRNEIYFARNNLQNGLHPGAKRLDRPGGGHPSALRSQS